MGNGEPLPNYIVFDSSLKQFTVSDDGSLKDETLEILLYGSVGTPSVTD